MPRRRLSILATALGTALGATAGGAAAADTVRLDVLYCNPSFARFFEPVAANFMAETPDVEIAFRAPCANYDEGHQQVMRSAVTGQLPDVFYSGFHLLEELAGVLSARTQITDLGPFLQAEGEAFVAANFEPSMLELGPVDGIQVGLAFNASSPIMYFNRDLVAQAGGDPDDMPRDWEGVLDLAAAIDALDDGIQGIAYDVQAWPDDWLWQALILQQGESMVREDGSLGFDGPAGLRALNLAREMVTRGGMELMDWDQSRQQFGAGRTGILFTTPAHLNQVNGMIGGAFDLGTTLFPLDNPEDGGVPTGGNALVILTQDPDKQAAAWEYARYSTGPEAQTLVVEMTGYLPLNIRALGDDFLEPFYAADENFRTVARQIDRSRPWRGYPGGETVRIWRAQRDLIGEVMRGTLSPEDGLEQIVAATRRMMN
ncbi:MAG: ABC transporter substrate-binding protein [Alkalilacustris sp.]